MIFPDVSGEEVPEAPRGIRELPALSGSLQPGSHFPYRTGSAGPDILTVSSWLYVKFLVLKKIAHT